MSNSKLVNYTRISPNRTSPRKNIIKKITIHHMAGNLTVESCGEVFASSAAQASSNYGIGTDGRIGLYVEEKDRSWASSSPDNDNQAVTIEVANDQIGGNWHVSDKALSKLIDLCVDICQRNGIKKLNYTGDKSGNLTMHKWFADTSCPGPYLESKFPYIAEQVNKRLNSSTSIDNDQIIWEFLKKNDLNDYGAAGLMGNLFAESGLNPMNLQNTFEKSLGHTDKSYTQAVDNGSYTNFVSDSAGYGLAQWTYHTRKQKLLQFAQTKKKSIGDLKMQLEFLLQELKDSYKDVFDTLKAATSVKQASNAVLLNFEKPANQSEEVQNKRVEYSDKYYHKFASKGSPTPVTTVYFSGNTHYVSVDASKGSPCTSGLAKITNTHKGAHPIHIRGIGGCTAYGWVDEKYVYGHCGVTTTALHLRTGGKVETESLGVMKAGTKVYILDVASTGWFKVYSVDLGKVGWCSNLYVID